MCSDGSTVMSSSDALLVLGMSTAMCIGWLCDVSLPLELRLWSSGVTGCCVVHATVTVSGLVGTVPGSVSVGMDVKHDTDWHALRPRRARAPPRGTHRSGAGSRKKGRL